MTNILISGICSKKLDALRMLNVDKSDELNPKEKFLTFKNAKRKFSLTESLNFLHKTGSKV